MAAARKQRSGGAERIVGRGIVLLSAFRISGRPVVMSSGLAARKRAVLAALEANEYAGEREAAQGLSTVELVERTFTTGYLPTRAARIAATRRALAGLVRAGLVIRVGTTNDNKRHAYWRATTKSQR